MFNINIDKIFAPVLKATTFQGAGNLNMINIIYFYNYVFLFIIFIFLLVSFLLIKTLYYFSLSFWYFINTKKYYYKLVIKFTLAYCEFHVCKFLNHPYSNNVNFNLKKDLSFNAYEIRKTKGLTYNYYFCNDSSLEFLWTLFPAVILSFIAGPSFELLYRSNNYIDGKLPELTINIIGHQWYWEYQYLDYSDFEQNYYQINFFSESEYTKENIKSIKNFDVFGIIKDKDIINIEEILINKTNPIIKYDFTWYIINLINYFDNLKTTSTDTVYYKIYLLSQYIFLFNIQSFMPMCFIKNLTLFDNLFTINPKTADIYVLNSYMKAIEDLSMGEFRLLEVDNEIVVPVDICIRFLITSADVLHSWAIPALGIKIDACPGRLNQIIETINQTGKYYGQCSELCGWNHGFMPIVIRAVDINTYNLWVITKFCKIKSNSTFNGLDFIMNWMNK